jgi:hypothetical protein
MNLRQCLRMIPVLGQASRSVPRRRISGHVSRRLARHPRTAPEAAWSSRAIAVSASGIRRSGKELGSFRKRRPPLRAGEYGGLLWDWAGHASHLSRGTRRTAGVLSVASQALPNSPQNGNGQAGPLSDLLEDSGLTEIKWVRSASGAACPGKVLPRLQCQCRQRPRPSNVRRSRGGHDGVVDLSHCQKTGSGPPPPREECQ